jgi:hypothetical protein
MAQIRDYAIDMVVAKRINWLVSIRLMMINI